MQELDFKNINYDDYFLIKILKRKPKSLSRAFRFPEPYMGFPSSKT